ncbi:hypothetical protein K456DRAFT_48821 [Colletotrichum gloeosporioides 23]|nr:hypothetical protein K456DRAFT_48821 [Colletotrichum gloeosporioides 23]
MPRSVLSGDILVVCGLWAGQPGLGPARPRRAAVTRSSRGVYWSLCPGAARMRSQRYTDGHRAAVCCCSATR